MFVQKDIYSHHELHEYYITLQRAKLNTQTYYMNHDTERAPTALDARTFLLSLALSGGHARDR